MIFLAIDPGIHGGIALFSNGRLTSCQVMPIAKVNYPSLRGMIDLHILGNLVMENQVEAMVIEEVTNYGRQAGQAVLLANFYSIAATCIDYGLRVDVVHPRTWTTARNGKGKDGTFARLEELNLIHHVPTKAPTGKALHDGIADAILLGWWFDQYLQREKSQ